MLFHVSEGPGIERFEPRPSSYTDDPVVWAIDAARLRNYLVPRECPRVTYYAGPETTADDVQRFLGSSPAVIAEKSHLSVVTTVRILPARRDVPRRRPRTANPSIRSVSSGLRREPGRGLAGGALEGLLVGRRGVEPAEAAVERLQRRQQQAERDQAVSDDPEDEPGGLLPDVVPRPDRAAEQGAGDADATERAGRGEAV